MSITTWRGLLLIPLIASCDSISGPICTQRDCQNGLSVVLSEPPTGAYTLEVLELGQEPRSFECALDTGCPDRMFFASVSAPQVTVRLTTSSGTRSEIFQLTYTPFQPNGPGCSPICFIADVTFPAG